MPETIAAPAPAAPAAVAPVAPAPAAPVPGATTSPTSDTLLGTPTVAPTEKPAPIAAEYKLTAPKDSGFDEAHVSGVAKWAADNKIAPEVAQAVLDRDHARVRADAQIAAESKERALTALKSAYTPDTLHEMDVAVTGYVRTHFGDEVAAWLKDTGLIFDRRIFDSFAKLAKAGAETRMATSQPTAAKPSIGKANFPRSPINWSPTERAEWEAAGRPQL